MIEFNYQSPEVTEAFADWFATYIDNIGQNAKDYVGLRTAFTAGMNEIGNRIEEYAETGETQKMKFIPISTEKDSYINTDYVTMIDLQIEGGERKAIIWSLEDGDQIIEEYSDERWQFIRNSLS